MGVLCHNNRKHIGEILTNARPKLKRGAYACHQYANWEKLDRYGWRRGGVPKEFREMSDDEIWWPRNSKNDMVELGVSAGWKVVKPDMSLLRRDSVIQLRNV